MTNSKLPKTGIVFYLAKKYRDPNEVYVPMSLEQWNDLRSYEPGKFTLDYDDYIRLVDRPGFEARPTGSYLELASQIYHLKEEYAQVVEESRTAVIERLKEIEQQADFVRWVPSDVVDQIKAI